MPQPSAAILAIGDELLSGRTRDANINHLATWLTERGVALREARIVSDDEAAIVDALNAMRAQFDYVFTSGGIGPTHDDITADSVAAAFGVGCVESQEALALMEKYYAARGQEVTPARRRMTRMPEGARLIHNSVSGAPGVAIENVFVMAGVPRIFRAMLDAVEGEINGGSVIISQAITAVGLPESRLAEPLAIIQNKTTEVSIGSYPIDGDELGVTVIVRSESKDLVEMTIGAVETAIRSLGFEPTMNDHKA